MQTNSLKKSSLFLPGEEHIISVHPISGLNESACDKPIQSRNRSKNLSKGRTMKDNAYTQLETEQKGYRVILEFPKKSDNEEKIHKEVKQILTGLLQEQKIQI